MKLPVIGALAISALALTAWANDDNSAVVVANPHGGYNVIQSGGHHGSIPFFGFHGFASKVIAHSHDKPKYILRPVVEDVGHGSKIVVYKKIYFATAEEAEAARLKQ